MSASNILAFAFVAALVVGWFALDGHARSKCEAAGGVPAFEYKALSSCWTQDGKRMFP